MPDQVAISRTQRDSVTLDLSQSEVNLLILTVARHIDFMMQARGVTPEGLLAGLSQKLAQALDEFDHGRL